MSGTEDKTPVICIDELTLILLTKKLEQNLLDLQENIKELRKYVVAACGRKRYREQVNDSPKL